MVRDGRLLLIRRSIDPWLGRWDIPGGFCEPDEHPEAAVVREVREETGLDVRVTGLLGIWMDAYGDASGSSYTTMNCYYHAVTVDDGEPVVDPSEASEASWFDPAALPDEIAFPSHAVQVLAAWREAVASGTTGTGAATSD